MFAASTAQSPCATPSAEIFYKTGGTMSRDTPSYVPRAADEELYRALVNGEFCYVLTSRQMGKSSLMVRTAARLRESGTAVVLLDLTAFGQNLNAEQWYEGMRERLGRHLDMEDRIDAYWQRSAASSPLQRWMHVISDIALPNVCGNLVIFIDEIDFCRSLPFSSDELFSAIRECYNRRTEDPSMQRLTFCLLGVASPSDLIRDTRTTPFNIGRRIELTDFTAAEAAPLARGLCASSRLAGALLSRILYWTGGQPYLTQRLCHAVATDPSARTERAVDRLCDELFLCTRARSSDENLLFVRERMLRGELDRASLLELYRKVRSGKRVPYEESNPLAVVLRLSGIARASGGRLHVRNRIYDVVFNKGWINRNLPDQELRRQRAAYLRGMFRVGTLSIVIVAAMTALALYANRERTRADSNRTIAESAQKLSNHAASILQNRLNDIGNAESLAIRAQGKGQLAESLVRQGDAFGLMRRWADAKSQFLDAYAQAKKLQDSDSPEPYALEADLGLAWAYANSPPPLLTLQGQHSAILSTAVSPDGLKVISGSWDGGLLLRELVTGFVLWKSDGHPRAIRSVTFSPDGRRVLSGGDDGTIRIWDANAGTHIRTIPVFQPGGAPDPRNKAFFLWGRPTCTFAFSSDCSEALVGDERGGLRLYNLNDPSKARALIEPGGPRITCVALSPTTPLALVATEGSSEWKVEFRDLTDNQSIFPLVGHDHQVWAACFSSDGARAITGGYDNTVRVWDTRNGRNLRTLKGPTAGVRAVAVSPDNRYVLAGSEDSAVRLWDLNILHSDYELRQYTGHSGLVRSVGFSADGTIAVSGANDELLQVWDVNATTDAPLIDLRGISPQALAVSADGKLALCGPMFTPNNTSVLWDIATSKRLWSGPVRVVRRAGDRIRIVRGDGKLLGEFVERSGRMTGQVAPLVQTPTDELVFKSPEGLPVISLAAHDGKVRSIEFSSDGKLAVSGGEDRTLRVWDVATGAQLHKFLAHSNVVNHAHFSADQRLIVSSGADNMIKVWNVGTQREIRFFSRHHPDALVDGSMWTTAFTPDTSAIIACSSNGMAEIWNLTRPGLYREIKPRVLAAINALASDRGDGHAMADLGAWYSFRGAGAWAALLLHDAKSKGAAVSSLELARNDWRAGHLEQARAELETALANAEVSADYLRMCIAGVSIEMSTRRVESVRQVIERIKQHPEKDSDAKLWDLLSKKDNEVAVVQVEGALREFYFSTPGGTRVEQGLAKPKLAQDMSAVKGRLSSASVAQRSVALALLATGSPADAVEGAAAVLNDRGAPSALRLDALQILLMIGAPEVTQPLAAKALAEKDPEIQRAVIAYLAIGPYAVRQLRSGIYLNVSSVSWWERKRSLGDNPSGVPGWISSELLDSLLHNGEDDQLAACAGYLLALRGNRDGLKVLSNYWSENTRNSVPWQLMMVRAIAALDDEPGVRIIGNIFDSLLRDGRFLPAIRELYQAVVPMKNAAAVALRQRMEGILGEELKRQ